MPDALAQAQLDGCAVVARGRVEVSGEQGRVAALLRDDGADAGGQPDGASTG